MKPTDILGNIKLYNADCMEVMKTFKDKQFDLAIVDPPYGIGIDGQKEDVKQGRQIRKAHDFKGWDNAIPSEEYFIELKRVSRNQIIWGGNYFTKFLPPTKAWIFWYKGQQGLTMSDGEMAWTSLKTVTRMVDIHRTHLWQEKPDHPTQKPVKLYKWLLQNYAKEGDDILDTHSGSLSIGIACHDMKFDLTAIELDKGYYEQAKQRLINHQRQLTIF
jgi:site-specific DNA-methyltransferase (adenine-specific)